MSNRAAMGAEDEAVKRVLARMSDDYPAVLAAEVERMELHLARMRAAPENGDCQQALFRIAHDIKGQAATFDHPLAGSIAERLCRLLRDAAPGGVAPDLIAAHVAALHRVASDGLRGAIDAAGAALLERLDHGAGLR